MRTAGAVAGASREEARILREKAFKFELVTLDGPPPLHQAHLLFFIFPLRTGDGYTGNAGSGGQPERIRSYIHFQNFLQLQPPNKH